MNKSFSHIYIEERAFDYPLTKKIVKKLKDSIIINIKHYKDVFSIERQNALLEKISPNLILAVNENRFLYEGSNNCQSFGNEKYYYVLTAMNCPFDCDYCFLKGMYPSANIVIFVNIEDAFKEIDECVGDTKALINLSFETDLIAIDSIGGMIRKWRDFANKRENLSFEIRTKAVKSFKENTGDDRLIYAFTLSPDEIIKKFERNTPNLLSRIESVNSAISAEKNVRLCFDPLIHTTDYQKIYTDFFDKIENEIDFSNILDVSLGTFRMPSDYLKNMRKRYGENEISLYPYEIKNKTAEYCEEVKTILINMAMEKLLKIIPKEKVFVAEEN